LVRFVLACLMIFLTFSNTRSEAASRKGGVEPARTNLNPALAPGSGLVAAYSFSEGSGSTTADTSGNNHTGSLVNGVAWTAAGKNGNALSFNGTNSKVSLPSSLDIATVPFTFEAWIRPTSFSDWRAIFSKRASYNSSQMRFDVGLAISSGSVYITTQSSFIAFDYVPPLNTWTHLAVVAQSAGTALYVNGALQQSLGAITLGTNGAAPVAVGNTGDDDDPFSGQIDDLRLYSRALGQTEIAADMNTAVDGSSDTTPPTVSVSSPAAGVTVSGSSVPVSATASDDVGVVGVQFKLDGAAVAAEDTASPYSINWNTATTTNGSHNLTATARDAAGNQTTSSPVTITVDNVPDTIPPSTPTNFSAVAVSSSQIGLSWTASSDNVAVAGYEIERCQGWNCTNFAQIASVAGTAFDDSGLIGDTSYRYRIRAADAAGNRSGYSIVVSATTQAVTATYGLEWPGDGAVRRMLYWHNPFPIYDATYIFKVFPRKKTSGAYRYYTTFFWGNDGRFDWDTGNTGNTYYGAHPYPIPAPGGAGQWEISVASNDFTTGQEVEWNRWHTQVFRAWRESSSITHHEFYWDWPNMSRVITSTVNDPGWADRNPPTPSIVIGQAPDFNGQSWGSYPGWEEFNGVIRGIQIYSRLLSLTDIQAEMAAPKSSANGQAGIWYLNLNPRPGDVTDKKAVGTPHNPSWDGTTALEWIGAGAPPIRRRGQVTAQ
jgi:hypothetical protein